MRNKNFIPMVILAFFISSFLSAAPTKPTLPNGTTSWGTYDVLKSSDLNAFFDSLFNWANGNITTTNLASDSGIAKLPTTFYSTTVTTATTTVTLTGGYAIAGLYNTFIYIDGVLQTPLVDYTVPASATIVFNEILYASPTVQIYKFN